jgi:spermidine synthase
MKPEDVVDSERCFDSDDLILVHTAVRWEVFIGSHLLMSSDQYVSEKALAELPLKRLPSAKRVLVGGLGLGFTARAALDLLPSDGEVVVAETSEALVRWNRTHVADLAARPLDDPRTRLAMGDVVEHIAESDGVYDVLMLDVDNGPKALIIDSNGRLYDEAGIAACVRSLRPGGVLAVWSAFPNEEYVQRLRDAGLLDVEAVTVPAGGTAEYDHVIFLGNKP